MGISPLVAGVWLLAGRGAGSWPPSRALQGSPPSPVPLYRGPGSAAEPRDNSALSVEHHEHMVGNRPPPDAAQLSAARDSLPRDRVFGPLNLPCCTCAAGTLAAAAAPPAQLTGCELCGRWRGRGAAASHVGSDGKIGASVTALQTLAAPDVSSGWLWVDAYFDSLHAPCIGGWDDATALRCVSGRKIMFEGDSFVRNVFMGLLKVLEGKLGDGLFAYPKSGWLAGLYQNDGQGLGKGSEFTERLFNGKGGQGKVDAISNLAGAPTDASWVRYYNNVYNMDRLNVLQQQVEKLRPDVLVVGLPGIHDHIARRDPVVFGRKLGEWARTVQQATPRTRVIYLSINVQDEAKKPKQFRSQGRDWSIGFIRKLVRTLIDLGVEVSALGPLRTWPAPPHTDNAVCVPCACGRRCWIRRPSRIPACMATCSRLTGHMFGALWM